MIMIVLYLLLVVSIVLLCWQSFSVSGERLPLSLNSTSTDNNKDSALLDDSLPVSGTFLDRPLFLRMSPDSDLVASSSEVILVRT